LPSALFNRVKERAGPKQKIILTGCILEADKEKFKKLGVEIKQFKGLEKIKPRPHSTLRNVECEGFVPIMQGCDNFCSYCVVPYTRGRERCRPPEEIICEVKHLIKKGIKEITLLGQNVNSYRYQVKSEKLKVKSCSSKLKVIDFADLLREINDLPGDFKLRFLTNHPKDMTDKLIDAIAQCKKVEKYIHLPVQSGDNEILRKMNRGYTREHYLALVKKIRQKIPDVELTTDIIVGFPGETQQAFRRTLDLFKQCRFANAFIAKYSPRPGTAAYKLTDDVPTEEKKDREKILNYIPRKGPNASRAFSRLAKTSTLNMQSASFCTDCGTSSTNHPVIITIGQEGKFSRDSKKYDATSEA
jgi:tRNA-2-methylthio-N6-dimethylallyladenosine synthase